MALAAVVALSLGLQPASDRGLSLAWHASDECPDADTVRARILAGLDDIDAPIVVHATATRTEETWRLLLQIDAPGGRGVRELEGDSCDALVDAATVVVAIVARGEIIEPAPEIVPAPTEPAATPPASAPVATRAPEIAPPREPPPRRWPGWHIGVAGAFDAAILPRPGGTLSAEVGPAWPRVVAAIGVIHAIARTRHAELGAGRYAMWAATVRGGPRLVRERFVVAGLVGAELGALLASGRELPVFFERTHLWSAATAALEVGGRITSRWTAAASLGFAVPLRRWTFAADEVELGEVGRIGVRAGLRLAYERRGRVRIPRGGGQP